jgi:hypothetical protein
MEHDFVNPYMEFAARKSLQKVGFKLRENWMRALRNGRYSVRAAIREPPMTLMTKQMTTHVCA